MRIVYIANRLPLRIEEDKKGFIFKSSPGGLATGLSSHIAKLSEEHLWIGWPGTHVPLERQERLKQTLFNKKNAYPVFLSEDVTDGYYNGFCNKVIWPLFHYFTNLVAPEADYWKAYVSANEHFAKQIAPLLRDDDIIGIHDYHLMLLPSLLRKYNKNLSISFFLHTPFPALDVLRVLPQKWRTSLLEGMMGADLIGFHTHEYRQHFLMSTLKLLGAESNMGNISYNDRIVKAGVFPMGIDVNRFKSESESSEIKKKAAKLKQDFGKRKLIFSVDRLDYTKGIAKRLLGFEEFLKTHPEWHVKVTLVVSSEPSRTDIEQYKAMKREVDELVGRINGLYGGLSWQPIIYQYTSLTFNEMVALYKASDVALITPLRDGMNLVAKEYIASIAGRKGVLILSEMAGASEELSEAILINPFDIQAMAQAIHKSLVMPEEEQIRRNKRMLSRIEKYDIHHWADDLTSSLIEIKKIQNNRKTRFMTQHTEQKLQELYKQASRRLIFLDYDGTLVPFKDKPWLAKPTKDVKERLRRLTSDPKNEVVLISGRDKKTLSDWLDIKNLALVAEHGVWKKGRQEYYWNMMGSFSNTWKPSVVSLLQKWVDRVPKSFIEEKEYSIAWHYRQVPTEVASVVTKDILFELITFTSTIDAEVIHDNKVIEIKNIGADKGSSAQHWLSRKKYDFTLAIGDERTDEDLFASLPDEAISIKVGQSPSIAKYRLEDHIAVSGLLDEFLNLNDKEEIILNPNHSYSEQIASKTLPS